MSTESIERNQEYTATVVRHTGSNYILSKLPEWNPFPAVIRGKLRLKGVKTTNPVAVGDIVEYRYESGISQVDGNTPVVITSVAPRRNYIIRRAANLSRQYHIIAANLDLALLVVTMDFPEVKWPFIDRFLVTCAAYGVPVKIVVNKMDLVMANEQVKEKYELFRIIYRHQAGYEIIESSTIASGKKERQDKGVEAIRELCRGKKVLLCGQSGVGKSSLINVLNPELNLKTADISDANNQGKHTTTFYQMHPLPEGGWVIDSPGIRGFGIVDLREDELSTYFPEMLRVSSDCRFTPCSHTHEPGCAVIKCVEEGIISEERYNSYLGMLEDNNEGKYRK